MGKFDEWTRGRDEALLNKIGGIENAMKILRGELVVVPADATGKPVKSSQPKLLIPDGYLSPVEVQVCFDPKAYYQTRSDLCFYDDFSDRIVAAAQTVDAGKKFGKAPRFKLGRGATGEMLKSARPKAVWNATDFCAWLAAKLAKQPNGKAGELLNTEWANLFLVEGVNSGVFVAYVYWSSLDRRWYVGTWRLGDEVSAGRRFASKPTD